MSEETVVTKTIEEPTPVIVATPANDDLGDVREAIGSHAERLNQHDEKLAEHAARHAEHEALFDELKQSREFDREERASLWAAHREAMEAIEAMAPAVPAPDIVPEPIVIVEDGKDKPKEKAKSGRIRLFGGVK